MLCCTNLIAQAVSVAKCSVMTSRDCVAESCDNVNVERGRIRSEPIEIQTL